MCQDNNSKEEIPLERALVNELEGIKLREATHKRIEERQS
jgi:hypothetical protein